MHTPTMETNRLFLRPIKKDDVGEIYNCWMRDKDVSRYMYWKASDDISETERFVDFETEKLNDDFWYRWLLIEKISGKMAGTCLIYFNEDEKCWDISYNLGKNFWGKGYITEAMKKILDFAGNTLDIEEFIAVHAIENTASGKVIEKLGFLFEKEVPYDCSGGEIHTKGRYYRLKFHSNKREFDSNEKIFVPTPKAGDK